MTNHLKYFFGILLLLVLSSSCQHSEQAKSIATPAPEKPSALTIVDKGIKTFPIAEDAGFEQMKVVRVTELNGKEYFSFFYQNMYDMFLYLYDYENGEVLKKITFVLEGPNMFNASMHLNYFIHTLDSIFVGNTNGNYAIMNDQSEIIKKIGKWQQEPGRAEVKFDETSFFDGKLIHTSPTHQSPYQGMDMEYTRVTIEPTINLNLKRTLPTRSFIQHYDEISKLRKAANTKRGYQIPVQRQIQISSDKLYASNPMSDSLLVFSKFHKLINTLYAGIPGVDVTNYKAYLKTLQVKQLKKGLRRQTVLNQAPSFITTLIDPQGKFIYRVLIEKTRGKYSEIVNEEFAVPAKASLLVINLRSDELYTYPLPLDEIELQVPIDNRPFVSNAGIHFRVKNQENEDQVQFRVFGPKANE